MSLEDYRREIDEIDRQILSLLQRRSECAAQIGEIKNRVRDHTETIVYVPHRERQIIDQLKRANQNRFPENAIEKIYGEIISACRAIEKDLKIAYLGPPGSFGHLASVAHFGSSATYVPIVPQIEIFTEVESRRVNYGVVAIENSTHGIVRDVLERFQNTELKICSEREIQIKQNLLSRSSIDQIKKIYSHSQSFAQCRQWLSRNLSGVEQIAVASTSTAAQIANSDPTSAAIASDLAAEIHDLNLVERSIMDSPNNVTRFLVIGDPIVQKTENNRTSILFSVKDEIGALSRVLRILETEKINLSNIVSLPSRNKAWEYVFFVDFDAHASEENVEIALDLIEKNCHFLKVLGSYPRF